MELYVQRHAIAVERGTEGYRDDSKRPLTVKGMRKMREAAGGMHALELSPDLILSSPFVRARQTAEIVAKVLRLGDRLEFTTHLQVGGDPRKLIALLRKQCKANTTVLLVGHEPYLSSLVSVLISGGGNVPMMLKKGGLCKLSISHLRFGKCATLEWFLTPSQLSRMR